MKDYWKPATLLILCWIPFLLISTSDYEDELQQYEHYCEMVTKWNENKHLPPEQRPGWPPYDGECDE